MTVQDRATIEPLACDRAEDHAPFVFARTLKVSLMAYATRMTNSRSPTG